MTRIENLSGFLATQYDVIYYDKRLGNYVLWARFPTKDEAMFHLSMVRKHSDEYYVIEVVPSVVFGGKENE